MAIIWSKNKKYRTQALNKKAFFIIFKELLVDRNCLRSKSAPLIKLFLVFYDDIFNIKDAFSKFAMVLIFAMVFEFQKNIRSEVLLKYSHVYNLMKRKLLNRYLPKILPNCRATIVQQIISGRLILAYLTFNYFPSILSFSCKYFP